MKILTLNTHSLAEPDYDKKLLQFAEVIETEQPAVFALQEVNQSVDAPAVLKEQLTGYVPCKDFDKKIRQDNHAYQLSLLLKKAGLHYEWTWISAKLGYGIYDEGLALFSLKPIRETRQFYISNIKNYENWKTRKVLGINTEGSDDWYYTVHMGWWDDEEERFKEQWKRFQEEYRLQNLDKETVFVLGDFNSPAEVSEEGYDYVLDSGWYDTWQLAEKKDAGITVGKVIDGWRERMSADAKGMRIDYIWCNQPVCIKESKVICNGEMYPVVSDHYGIIIETGKEGV